MNRNNFIPYLLILSIFVLSIQSSLAKDFKFQLPFSRDCRLYEELYEGISCRNASFEDIPICEESEEIVSSPRRGRLCCCTREGEEIGEIGESILEGEICQIIGCENASNPTGSKSLSSLVCSRSELSVTGIGIINTQNPNYNVTNYCCCPSGVAMLEAISCSNYINCRELTGLECTHSFPSFDEINVDQGVDETIDRTFSCCCLPAKTE